MSIPKQATLAPEKPDAKEVHRRLEDRAARGRDQTTRADTKAQIIAAGVAAVAAVIVASGSLTGLSVVTLIPAWVAVAATVAAVAALGVVLWPRAPRPWRPNVDLILGHAQVDDDVYALDLASEIRAIEDIRDMKFRLLQTALCLLAAAAFFAAMAATITVF